jgi:hypothetical protein
VIVLGPERSLLLEREGGRAVFTGVPPPPDEIVHPLMGPVGTVFGRWAGREAFHGGAFIGGGRAWIVLGAREAGKSTLLAALAGRGIDVLSDDVVVTDGHVVYAGPRCVDLRQAVPRGIPGVELVRAGRRHRAPLPHVPPAAPLGGWIELRWGPGPEMRPVPTSAWLPELARRRAWRHLPSDPARFLDLAARPAWRLTRPPDWMLDATVEVLVAQASGAAA